MLHTPLYPQHLALQAKLIPFGDWEMPLHYGSQLEEHHAVRKQAGLFDVSHMMITDLFGKDSDSFLRYLLANDIGKLQTNQALYGCLLKEDGGILDDVIVYFINKNHYRMVSNATTRPKIRAWLQSQQAAFPDLTLQFRDDLAMIALQGPTAFKVLHALGFTSLAPNTLKPFYITPFQSGWLSRTGYTGEWGVEVMLPLPEALAFWQACLALGVKPCGLGARDTLRLEMGYNLYGVDMDETTTPLESNLAWTVSFTPDRHFIGKQALETQRQQGILRHLVGLTLQDKGVPRSHYEVCNSAQQKIGEITSGTFSPTLHQGIALARITQPEPSCLIKIRDHFFGAHITKPPFVKLKKEILV